MVVFEREQGVTGGRHIACRPGCSHKHHNATTKPTYTDPPYKQEVARKKTEEKALLAEWGREKEELEGTKNAQKELEAARRCVSDEIVYKQPNPLAPRHADRRPQPK